MKVIKVATRGSKLALKQTYMAINYLKQYIKNAEFEIKVIKTSGDKDQNKALYNMDSNGIFVKDIEEALLNNEADIAIHSLKDVGSNVADGLMLLPYTIFEDKRDCLITKNNQTMKDIKINGTIATSSIRRMACIKRIRPDINFVNIRGNIDTRINKFMNSEYDGLVLASAGLKRLGLDNYISEYLDPKEIIPACGQGTIAIEVKQRDRDLFSELFEIRDIRQKEVEIEREFLKISNSDCHSPIGCYCKADDKEIDVYAMKGSSIDDCKFIHEKYDLNDHNIADKLLRKLGL